MTRFIRLIASGSDKKPIFINPDRVISVQRLDDGIVELSVSDSRSIYVVGEATEVSARLGEAS